MSDFGDRKRAHEDGDDPESEHASVPGDSARFSDATEAEMINERHDDVLDDDASSLGEDLFGDGLDRYLPAYLGTV